MGVVPLSAPNLKKNKMAKNINKHSVVDHHVLSFLKDVAKQLSKKFKFNYSGIHLMSPDDEDFSNCWGYCVDGHIVVCVRRGRRYMALEEILDTLIHELAHLGQTDDDFITIKALHDNKWKKKYDNYYHWIKKSLSKGENECLFIPEI